MRWGHQKSPQRLYAISKFLTWLCSFQGGEKPTALKRWIEDLAWLKANCYQKGMGFAWPEEATLNPPKSSQRRVPNAAFMELLTPSDALAAVIGPDPLPRTEIVSKLWTYIKKMGLQDRVNKRMINADSRLQKVFGKSQVSMFEMAGLIGKHVK
jgi:hypothetical protein